VSSNNREYLIKELCGRFESELRSGGSPDISKWLDQVDAEDQRQLLRHLLELEIEIGPPEQRDRRVQRYAEALPQFAAFIHECFAAMVPDDLRTVIAEAPDPLATDWSSDSAHAGNYKLLQKIGEGGMGTVWLAEQQQPVRRRVALKIIKPGLNSKQVIARFEAERQALAMMDHPCIARILDAGTNEDGQPYFAMELVKGLPLTEYCDAHRIDLETRLKLFMQVCEAVQHAHQKGIIHRDLKPSNILVAEYNGQPIPKVIDFGLAKALEATQKLTDKSLFTEFGYVLGTLAYMSPEQANLDSLDIDTRTDIYALGVILYELLTGSTPLDQDSFKGHALFKILELIRQHESPRPSSRLSSAKIDMLTAIAEKRKTDGHRLRNLLAGDLDWIALKALDKDRNRRYDTATSLANDIARFLNNDVVLARPPSAMYRCTKFVRRNRNAIIGLSAVAFLLITGIICTGLLSIWAMHERKIAVESQNEAILLAADKTRLLADAQRLTQEKTELADRKQKIIDAFVSAFRSTNPAQKGTDSEMTARELLLQAVDRTRADQTLANDQLTKATLLAALGKSLIELGEYSSAVSPLVDSLGISQELLDPGHRDIRVTMNELADCYLRAGEWQKAVEMGETAYALYKKHEGIADEDTLVVAANLATYKMELGEFDYAIEIYEQILEQFSQQLGDRDLKTIQAKNLLAVAQFRSGNPTIAISLFEDILRQRKSVLGEDHPDTLQSQQTLAAMLYYNDQYERCIEIANEVVRLQTKKLGADHPDTLQTKNTLAAAYEMSDNFEMAAKCYRETFQLAKQRLGETHPFTLTCMNNLAVGLKSMGMVDEALPIYREMLDLQKQKIGPDHPDTLMGMNNLARAYEAAKEFELAREVYSQTIEAMTRVSGEDHLDTLFVKRNLGKMMADRGYLRSAKETFEEVLDGRRENPNCPQALLVEGLTDLAATNQGLGLLDDSRLLFEEAVELEQQLLGEESPERVDNLLKLQNLYSQMGSFEEALNLATVCKRFVDSSRPESESRSFHLDVSHADSLAHLNRYAEALELIDRSQDYELLTDLDRGRGEYIRGYVARANGHVAQSLETTIHAAEILIDDYPKRQRRFWWIAVRACDSVIDTAGEINDPNLLESWVEKKSKLVSAMQPLD
jgi:serine/threonine protein kinase